MRLDDEDCAKSREPRKQSGAHGNWLQVQAQQHRAQRSLPRRQRERDDIAARQAEPVGILERFAEDVSWIGMEE